MSIPNPLTKPCLIVCEGERDSYVLTDLLIQRKLIDYYEIAYSPVSNTHGRQGFRDILTSVYGMVGAGFEDLKYIVLISDNDEKPHNSFKELQDIVRAVGHYGVPTSAQHLEDPITEGYPKLTVFMLPTTGQQGQLEDLCLTAAAKARPELQQPLKDYSDKVVDRPSKWAFGRKAKMQVRILMATHYPKPNTEFRSAWQWKPHLMPTNHSCFNELAAFLDMVRKQRTT
jgi:hypothetical protein